MGAVKDQQWAFFCTCDSVNLAACGTRNGPCCAMCCVQFSLCFLQLLKPSPCKLRLPMCILSVYILWDQKWALLCNRMWLVQPVFACSLKCPKGKHLLMMVMAILQCSEEGGTKEKQQLMQKHRKKKGRSHCHNWWCEPMCLQAVGALVLGK